MERSGIFLLAAVVLVAFLTEFATGTRLTSRLTGSRRASTASKLFAQRLGEDSPLLSPLVAGPNHTFTFFNDCHQTLWIATLPNPGHPEVLGGGFEMEPSTDPLEVQVPYGWQGRIWARTGCRFSPSKDGGNCNPPGEPCCATGNCVDSHGDFGLGCIGAALPPSSLLEVALDSPSGFGPYDDYDISLVDGWNVVMTMEPVNGSFNPKPDPGVTTPWCELTGCPVLPICPPEYILEGVRGACWSPCQWALKNQRPNQPESWHEINQLCCICNSQNTSCNCGNSNDKNSSEYGCCKGGYGCSPGHTPTPYANDTVCNPWSKDRGWPRSAINFIEAVEKACSKVYSWQYDDHAATLNCRKTDGVVDYHVHFYDQPQQP